MLDLLYSLGQAASALLLAYGGYLVLFSGIRRKAPVLDAALQDEFLLRKHLLTDV